MRKNIKNMLQTYVMIIVHFKPPTFEMDTHFKTSPQSILMRCL